MNAQTLIDAMKIHITYITQKVVDNLQPGPKKNQVSKENVRL